MEVECDVLVCVQYSLVVWVSVRTGTVLAVLWSTSSGITEKARSALLTELPLGVM